MSNELFTIDGKRKYLTAEERERFIAAATELERGEGEHENPGGNSTKTFYS